MVLTRISVPAAAVLDASGVREHCIIDDQRDDYLLERLIAAATAHLDGGDGVLGRALITQGWTYYRSCWPCGDRFSLPLPPVLSVEGVAYRTAAGVWTPMVEDTDYLVDTDSEPGQIVLPYGRLWPTVALYPVNPIRVQMTCGYGAAAEDVPEAIKHAMYLLIAHWHLHREEVIIGPTATIAVKPPNGFDALIAPYCMHFQDTE